jgi:DeoR family fructose operon transcriptional repressor
LLTEERYQRILSILEKERSVKVSNLMKLFNISIETVRRDLEHLEGQGQLKRVYGGAVIKDRSVNRSLYSSFKSRESKSIGEKIDIANIAIRYVSEGQSLALDSGTTILEFAKMLKKNFEKLTILTHSLIIANELAEMEKYTIILTGGILKNDEHCLVADMAIDNIGRFNIDKAFISASGISLIHGLTDCRMDEVQIQRKMIDVSQETIVLDDNSKFDQVSLLKICDINKVNMIITDSKLDKAIYDKYTEAGVNVVSE